MLRSSSGTKNTFPALRKALRLLVPDIDEREPADVAYAYAGYAPITLRLVEGLLEVRRSPYFPLFFTANVFVWHSMQCYVCVQDNTHASNPHHHHSLGQHCMMVSAMLAMPYQNPPLATCSLSCPRPSTPSIPFPNCHIITTYAT